jgi:hypothetical protein
MRAQRAPRALADPRGRQAGAGERRGVRLTHQYV